jgi:hypothetical protein
VVHDDVPHRQPRGAPAHLAHLARHAHLARRAQLLQLAYPRFDGSKELNDALEFRRGFLPVGARRWCGRVPGPTRGGHQADADQIRTDVRPGGMARRVRHLMELEQPARERRDGGGEPGLPLERNPGHHISRREESDGEEATKCDRMGDLIDADTPYLRGHRWRRPPQQ